mmetsp:Transcript_15069/g.40730  ORF Transcript_15069/g.40730 Transcript_15069/m.40730 type:complete len:243 (+) Transcript_15069:249-977(+)
MPRAVSRASLMREAGERTMSALRDRAALTLPPLMNSWTSAGGRIMPGSMGDLRAASTEKWTASIWKFSLPILVTWALRCSNWGGSTMPYTHTTLGWRRLPSIMASRISSATASLDELLKPSSPTVMAAPAPMMRPGLRHLTATSTLAHLHKYTSPYPPAPRKRHTRRSSGFSTSSLASSSLSGTRGCELTLPLPSWLLCDPAGEDVPSCDEPCAAPPRALAEDGIFAAPLTRESVMPPSFPF